MSHDIQNNEVPLTFSRNKEPSCSNQGNEVVNNNPINFKVTLSNQLILAPGEQIYAKAHMVLHTE